MYRAIRRIVHPEFMRQHRAAGGVRVAAYVIHLSDREELRVIDGIEPLPDRRQRLPTYRRHCSITVGPRFDAQESRRPKDEETEIARGLIAAGEPMDEEHNPDASPFFRHFWSRNPTNVERIPADG